MAAQQKNLAARLNRARNAVESVLIVTEDRPANEGGDAGEIKFARASEVRAVARAALSKQQLVIVPTSVDVAVHGQQVVVNRGFMIFNSQDVDEDPIYGGAAGSASLADGGVSAAQTIAEKSFLLSLLDIPTHDQDSERERREQQRDNRRLTGGQINGYIRPAQRRASVTDEQLAQLVRDEFGADELRKVRMSDADRLVEAIKKLGSAAQ